MYIPSVLAPLLPRHSLCHDRYWCHGSGRGWRTRDCCCIKVGAAGECMHEPRRGWFPTSLVDRARVVPHGPRSYAVLVENAAARAKRE